MNNSTIYHICTIKSWQEQSKELNYGHESLNVENFIHCSHKEQLKGVLAQYFTGSDELFLLKIECAKLIPEIKYEKAPIGEYFPHIYGYINKDAIIEIQEIDKSKWR